MSSINSARADPADASLVAALRFGDVAALGALYDRHGRYAFGLAYRLLGDRARAEDVVREAFLAIWQDAPCLAASPEGVSAWLFASVRRLCLETKRSTGANANEARRAGDPVVEDVAASEAAGCRDHTSLISNAPAIHRAFASLPTNQQLVIGLACFDGLTLVQIAARIGAPLELVRGQMGEALSRLHLILNVS